LAGVGTLALGSLSENPFADSTPEFDRAMEALVQRALGRPLCIVRPFASLSKCEVIRRGASLPLDLTFSCIKPVQHQHCGECNKCAERRRAFRQAGIPDNTPYILP
jgi:7-cyano-7-deazaguanine synthase